MNAKTYAELKSLSEKIATELVFAEAGKDLGLLPVNNLLSQIEELIAANSAPDLLMQGAKLARSWVDGVFESTGTFSTASLKQLGEWVAWWQEALAATEAERTPAALPAAWQSACTAAAAPTPIAAPPAPSSQAEPVLVLNIEQDGELLNEFIN